MVIFLVKFHLSVKKESVKLYNTELYLSFKLSRQLFHSHVQKTDLQKLAILRIGRFSKSVRRRFVAVDVKVLRRSRQPQNDPVQFGLHENLAACKKSKQNDGILIFFTSFKVTLMFCLPSKT